ncbi:hypothetical protein AMR74_13410 [Halorubrum tropicale]|uniref:Uncharacterized protein n=1 Tax=Halorubrum tropicale TaxID=1765655 RepID=A0A0M9ARC4_9EURY|nr:hypothetical protein AMR74_13410 [Halorubrum tropicale]
MSFSSGVSLAEQQTVEVILTFFSSLMGTSPTDDASVRLLHEILKTNRLTAIGTSSKFSLRRQKQRSHTDLNSQIFSMKG